MRTGDGTRLRREKFAGLLRRPWYLTLVLVVPCGVLGAGAYYGVPALAFGGSGLALAALLIAGFAWASRSARLEVMQRFAAAHGLVMREAAYPPSWTPLLRAGDERRLGLCMDGVTAGGMPVLVGHYTYTEISHHTDANGHTREERDDHDFTIAMTEVEAALGALPTLHLCPRRALRVDSGWLSTRELAKCETESVRFNERFKVWHREEQDPVVLRRMLDPSNVDALANHPLDVGVELAGGRLLVYVEGHRADTGELTGLLEVLDFLRRAVLAAARVDAASASAGRPGG